MLLRQCKYLYTGNEGHSSNPNHHEQSQHNYLVLSQRGKCRSTTLCNSHHNLDDSNSVSRMYSSMYYSKCHNQKEKNAMNNYNRVAHFLSRRNVCVNSGEGFKNFKN